MPQRALAMDPKDFVTIGGRRVYAKKWTEQEEKQIVTGANKADLRGDVKEYRRLGYLLPFDPGLADDMREAEGLESMIKKNVNFYHVLEAYGEQWFRQ